MRVLVTPKPGNRFRFRFSFSFALRACVRAYVRAKLRERARGDDSAVAGRGFVNLWGGGPSSPLFLLFVPRIVYCVT